MSKGMGQLKVKGLGKPVAMRKKDIWGVGTQRFKRKIQNTSEYRAERSTALMRAKNKCEQCGASVGELSPKGNIIVQFDMHHIHPFEEMLKKYKVSTLEQARMVPAMWDVKGVQILCHDCHTNTDSYGTGTDK